MMTKKQHSHYNLIQPCNNNKLIQKIIYFHNHNNNNNPSLLLPKIIYFPSNHINNNNLSQQQHSKPNFKIIKTNQHPTTLRINSLHNRKNMLIHLNNKMKKVLKKKNHKKAGRIYWRLDYLRSQKSLKCQYMSQNHNQ